MADPIGPILNVLTSLWYCSAKRVGYVHQLEKNLTSLMKEADELQSIWLDVKVKVELAEDQQLKRLHTVNDWLDKAEAMGKQVQTILQKGDQEMESKCLGGYCPKSCRASYKLGKMVMQKINEVRELINEGHFDVVATKVTQAVVERPLEKTVGLQKTFDELCVYFEDKRVGTIGLYGMGGVGKTSLLKKFNNDFLSTKTHVFDTVIWVVVSKEVDLVRVQQVIGDKLHVSHSDDNWRGKSVDDRAVVIYNILKKKKFVLLLDDMWKRVDLLKLGIPLPDNENGSKVIFTTRSEEVCSHMEAQRCIKVEPLPPEKAFRLFKEKVGEDTLDSHPLIPQLAKIMAAECKGLPLALCTVGRSMANKKTLEEWKCSIKILRSCPSRFSGMVDHVYNLLEFSYNCLLNATHRSCFLYCSLFPEDYSISKKELVQLWSGEGLLAQFDDDICEGEYIITSLKLACLLENGESEDSVKMHDVIRDMALWVACDHGSNTKFFVRDGSIGAYDLSNWKKTERVSLWGKSILDLSGKPDCSSLQTMLIRGTKLESFPTEMFLDARNVRVLDLSNNRSLIHIEGIKELDNLQYLNLSSTGIKILPVEMVNLKILRCLLLDFTTYCAPSKQIISSLLSLQVFSRLRPTNPFYEDDSILLKELEGLKHLKDISITLWSASSVQILLNSSKLQRCIRHLRLSCDSDIRSINMSFSSLRRMEHLEVLYVTNCRDLRFDMEKVTLRDFTKSMHEGIINLRELSLYACEIVNLNWLIHAPSLESLTVRRCPSFEEVISEDLEGMNIEVVNCSILSSLKILRLGHLRNLRSISRQALRLPCLKEIQVVHCPRLLKLPFDCKSASNRVKHVKGEESWWDQLQWQDEATKDIFSSKFLPQNYIS